MRKEEDENANWREGRGEEGTLEGRGERKKEKKMLAGEKKDQEEEEEEKEKEEEE